MARVIALALALLGCADPALSRYRDALDAYDAGREALSAGRAEEAAADFRRAAALDPDSATALAWQAWALDQAGKGSEALGVLDEALARFPADPTLRYNRAALRARAGALDGAAEDLRVLYAAGALDPVVAGEDPDFAALAGDPETVALAPPPAVEVQVAPSAGPVLIGDTTTLELSLRSRADELLSFTDQGAAPGLLRHTRTVEDLLEPEGRIQPRTLSLSFKAVTAGEGALGPWLVRAGSASGEVPASPVSVLALPGRAPAAPGVEGGALRSVEALFQGREPPWAGRDRGEVLVIFPPGASVEVTATDGAADPAPVALELRRLGQTELQGELHHLTGPAHVRVTRRGQPLLDGDVPVEP